MSDFVQIDLPGRKPSPSAQRRSGPSRPVGDDGPRQRLPPWMRVKMTGGPGHAELKRLVGELGLHTVCQEANCPNVGECWNDRELTLMILGDVCTRSCGFCDVKTGRPPVLDTDEPRRVAEALSRLDLRHAVITSVDRDELEDAGAGIWAETIRRVRASCPEMTLEVLIPDLKGRTELVDLVLDANPHVLAHNLETVPRLHPTVRPQAEYERSLSVLACARERGTLAKTGLMLGLGETREEIEEVLRDCADAGVDIVTLGQYLRPSKRHLAVERFAPPEEFAELAKLGESFGIRHVEAGPLVRSSYRAGTQVRALS